LNPETAATEHEFFRKMNESDESKKEILKGAMQLQHGTSNPLSESNLNRFHAILSRS